MTANRLPNDRVIHKSSQTKCFSSVPCEAGEDGSRDLLAMQEQEYALALPVDISLVEMSR